MMSRCLLPVVLSLLAVVTGCASGPRPAEKTVVAADAASERRTLVIGAILPISAYLQLAADEVNAGGRFSVRLLVRDDRGDAKQAEEYLRELDAAGANAVIGELTSALTMSLGPVAQRLKIPLVTPSATAYDVTQAGDYVSRVCFHDPMQASAMAIFASEDLKLKRVGIIYDQTSQYSTSLKAAFEAGFQSLGGVVPAPQAYSSGQTDFTGELRRIRREKCDGIFVPGYYEEAGAIIKQARRMGLTVPILGGDGWVYDEIVRRAGPAVENCFCSAEFFAGEDTKVVKGFLERYMTRFGAGPESMAARAYDALMLITDAAARCPDLSREGLKDAINSTRDFRGATGIITLDSQRNPVKRVMILRFAMDKPSLERSITFGLPPQ
jgi:branched-chain amino acid transport system substrate-binding protein